MNNKDLGGLPQKDVKKEVKDPTAEFDLTRKARDEALGTVRAAMNRSEDNKLSGKDVKKAIQGLYTCSKHTDDLLISLIRDIYRIVHAVAQGEVNTFTLRTNLKTVSKALIDKGVLDEEELKKLHDETVLKEELEKVEQAQGDS